MRPPLPVGTHGRISSRYLDGKTAVAWARFRDYDGVVRTVTKRGPTKGAAEGSLREALRDRQHAGTGSHITPATTVARLAEVWLAEPHDWAANTRTTYGYIVKNEIVPALGGLRVSELRLAVVNRALRAVRDRHGPGSAKTMRSALSGMCRLAIEHEALGENPVRDTVRLGGGRKERVRALTPAEADDLCDRLRSDETACALDLPDLVEWMLGTGARIGETLAARDEALEDGTWEVNATIVRIKGHGLVIQRRPKTAAGWRALALPPFAVAMAERRKTELRWHSLDGVVFPNPRSGELRDPSQASKDLRATLDRLGYEWVHSHVFRKTVATRMDEHGCTARVIADQLGHAKPSMTQDVYMGRQVVSAAAAEILDR